MKKTQTKETEQNMCKTHSKQNYTRLPVTSYTLQDVWPRALE